jgi:hypothetical protein
MLPLTDATIAYVIGGILEVRDAATILINRDLATWVRDEESDMILVPTATPTRAPSIAPPAPLSTIARSR